jgi:hypothetical protein
MNKKSFNTGANALDQMLGNTDSQQKETKSPIKVQNFKVAVQPQVQQAKEVQVQWCFKLDANLKKAIQIFALSQDRKEYDCIREALIDFAQKYDIN